MTQLPHLRPSNAHANAAALADYPSGVVVVVGAVAWGIYWPAYARYFESTDDAYVGGDVVAITIREPATVLALHADNTQTVRRGQLLVELDPATANVAMQSAQADLARTVRSVRSDFSKVDQLRAQIAAAQVQLTQAEDDYRRRKAASGDGSVSAEEVAHAHDAVTSAKATLAVSQSALAQALASVEGTSVATNPTTFLPLSRGCATQRSHCRICGSSHRSTA